MMTTFVSDMMDGWLTLVGHIVLDFHSPVLSGSG